MKSIFILNQPKAHRDLWQLNRTLWQFQLTTSKYKAQLFASKAIMKNIFWYHSQTRSHFVISTQRKKLLRFAFFAATRFSPRFAVDMKGNENFHINRYLEKLISMIPEAVRLEKFNIFWCWKRLIFYKRVFFCELLLMMGKTNQTLIRKLIYDMMKGNLLEAKPSWKSFLRLSEWVNFALFIFVIWDLRDWNWA